MAGRNDLKRANINKLLKEAGKNDWITQEEYETIDEIRKFRNPITHFRAPFEEDTIPFRSLTEGSHFYDTIENDARNVIITIMNLSIIAA